MELLTVNRAALDREEAEARAQKGVVVIAAERLDAVREVITAAVREAAAGERAAVVGAVVSTLYEVLAAYKRPGYQAWSAVGQTLVGELLPVPPDAAPGYRALRTEAGDVVIFSTLAKELASKLEGVPAGARVAITYLGLGDGGRGKKFAVLTA
jgi:hypothetical protein